MTEIVATAEARAERIRAGAEQAKAWIEDVMQAAVEGDWRTLDYASWQDYCDHVIGERVQLPREERQELVGQMREAGMSTRAIGAALGVSHPTVIEDGRSGGQNLPPDDHSVSGSGTESRQAVTGIDGRVHPRTQSTPAPPLPARQDDAEQAASEFDQRHDDSEGDDRRDQELENELANTDQRFLSNFQRYRQQGKELWTFDLNRIAETHGGADRQRLLDYVREMRGWCDRVEGALSETRHLRVAGGENR